MNIVVDSGFNDDYLSFLKKIKNTDVNIFTIGDYINNKVANVDLVLFTGGADVNPKLYNENKGSNTYINSDRDDEEYQLFHNIGTRTPKLGICRGAQLLTVLNKGKLIQDVTNHTSSHLCEGHYHGDIIEFMMTSTHHQMMYPFNLPTTDYKILAWSTYHKSSVYLNGEDKEIELPSNFLEPEIVYYPKYNSLAIQGHPEFGDVSDRTLRIIINYINNYLLNK